MSWAVFLDRDGTLNEEVGLLSRPEQVRLIAGSGAALRGLKRAGALLVVATNQSVVARGLVDEAGLRRVHERLEGLLREEGVELDGIYYCPHHPETNHPDAADPRYRRDCSCRKPKPGMLVEAAAALGIDPTASYMVGDSTRDVAAGRAAGCRTVLVRTGFAGKDGRCPEALPDAEAADLAAAAEWILADRRGA